MSIKVMTEKGKKHFGRGRWFAFATVLIALLVAIPVAVSTYFGTITTSSGRKAYEFGKPDEGDYSLRCYLDKAGALIPQGWVTGYYEKHPWTGSHFYSSGVSLSRFLSDYEEERWRFPTSEDERADPYQRLNGIFNLYGYIPGVPEYENKVFGWDLAGFDWVYGGLPSAEGQIAIPSYAFDWLVEAEAVRGAVNPSVGASSLRITLDEGIEYSICGVFASDPDPEFSKALLKLKLMPPDKTMKPLLTDAEVCAFLFPKASAFVYSPIFNLGSHHYGISAPLIPVSETNANATLEENGLVFSPLPYVFILDEGGYEDLTSDWNGERTYLLDRSGIATYDLQPTLFIAFAATSAALSAISFPLLFLLSKRLSGAKALAWSMGGLACSFFLGIGIGALSAYLRQVRFFESVILPGLQWLHFDFSLFWPLLVALGVSCALLIAAFLLTRFAAKKASKKERTDAMKPCPSKEN